jgi:hypothetical protein
MFIENSLPETVPEISCLEVAETEEFDRIMKSQIINILKMIQSRGL